MSIYIFSFFFVNLPLIESRQGIPPQRSHVTQLKGLLLHGSSCY